MSFVKRFILLILLLGCLYIVKAEIIDNISLTDDVIKDIRNSTYLSSRERAIMNALSNNDLKDIAVNRVFLNTHNNLFNYRIKTKGITDQEKSGRCWLFAGLNLLRPKVIKKYNLSDFEFSQSYLFFWDKMEKSNFFLESIIETVDKDLLDREMEHLLKRPISDGGWWSYVVNLINKYGLVPKSVMPETYNSTHTWWMNGVISARLREYATILRKMSKEGVTPQELREKKLTFLKTIYKMLVLNLGEPPTSFVWRYEDNEGNVSKPVNYTPEEFLEDVVGLNLRDYVALMNHPGKEYNRLYQFDMARNIYEEIDPIFINLGIKEMKEFTIKSILDNEPVWFACDIIQHRESEKGILSTEIIDYKSVYGIDIKLSKEQRLLYRESEANHAMVFLGVDIQNDKPVKWLVEDSHGRERGHEGHWTMYDDWFDGYVYGVIIHKKYLPEEIIDVLKQKPVHLPPWEPIVAIIRNTR